MLDYNFKGCLKKKKKNPPSRQEKQEKRATPQKGNGTYISANVENSSQFKEMHGRHHTD